MSNTVIKLNSVSKCYNISERGYRSFREEWTDWFKIILRSKRPKSGDIHSIMALKDVSFEVKKGEALGIIGANGSGKTTILRLLSKVTAPTKGSVDVSGKVAPLIQVGAGFHPELTGKENVYLNGTIMGLSKKEIDERYAEIVSFAELDRFMDTPVKRYSSGMYVRLGFAVVANINPDIFLIDEILSVGDLSFQRKCLDTMINIRKSDKSIVFVSHNISAVKGLCDRVIWLDKGEIKKEGDVNGVINAYISYMTSKSQFVNDISYIGQKTRWGTGEILIQNVKLFNSERKDTDNVYIGEDLLIEISFEVKKNVESAFFWVGILNDEEIKVSGSVFEMSKEERHLRPKSKGKLECVFESISLQPGKYHLIVGVFDEFKNLAYDRIGNVCEFIVVSKDNLYNGYVWDGVAYIPSKWKFHEM